MKSELKQLLHEIAKQKVQRGYLIQPPCPETDLNTMRNALSKIFHVDIPQSYEDLLREMNGVDFNGTLIFAASKTPHASRPGKFIEGVVDANSVRKIEPSEFLVIGESGMEMYAYNFPRRKWVTVDQVSMDIYETFETLDDVLIAALRKRVAKK